MFGYRKFIALIFIGMITAFVELNEHQAEVLAILGSVYLGSNASMAIARSIIEKVLNKTRVSGSSVSSSDSSNNLGQ